jgi:hypothetical protein
MVSEFDAAADIATGAVIARAVEPNAGDLEGGIKDGACLNCGAAMTTSFCGNCGQKSRVHRTLHAFGHDFLHSVLHLDGKIWRTLPLLFWNPGNLTRRYVHGERAKFVSPLALFLFMVFLTFAVFNSMSDGIDLSGTPQNAATQQKDYDKDRAEILSEIKETEAQRAVAVKEGKDTETKDDKLEDKRAKLLEMERERLPSIRKQEIAERKFAQDRSKIEADIKRLETDLAAAKAAGTPTEEIEVKLSGERAGLQVMTTAMDIFSKEKPELTVNSGISSLDEAAKHAMDNPQLLLFKIQSNAYKYSWALIPISLPFLWLLFFWRTNFKMFDHAVFITYSISFMMLLGVVSALLMQVPALEVIGGLALAFIPPIHIYRQLHHAYETTRFGAFWRMCLLSMFALTALTLFTVLIIMLGVTG